MLPLIDRLKDLAAASPTRPRWVIVPTHAVGRMITERLALDMGGWTNMRIVTPLDLALRMGAPFLVERGIDPSEEGLGPALIMRLALELPEADGYFRPLAHQPEMALALWRTLSELRMADVGRGDLEAASLVSADKQRELVELLAAYEEFLDATARGDRRTILDEALRHPDWCPIQPGDVVVEWPAIWSPIERRLLDVLPGERVVVPVTAPPGIEPPRRLRASLASPPPITAEISYFKAGGAEAEVEEVFRRVLTGGHQLDQVEIVCASHESAALVWEKAVRHAWPVTLAMGIGATLTRPGRALLGLAGWIEDNFSSGHLRRLLQSGDVDISPVGMSAGRAARLLVRARAGWGRETYARALGRYAAGVRRRADDDEIDNQERARLMDQAEETDRLAGWLGALIDRVPSPGVSGRVALQPIIDLAMWFVDAYGARASALDHLAAARLASAIAELRALGDVHQPLSQALHFIAERVESLHIGSDRARPGHLHATRLPEAGLSGRPIVFVVGLEEGRVFPASFEDPILLDDERLALTPALKRSTDVVDEAVFAATSRLVELAGTAGTSLTLSYTCRDLRQFCESHPSWLLLYMNRLQTGIAARSFANLEADVGSAVSCVPVDACAATTVGRWWLHGVTRIGSEAGGPAVLRAFPHLTSGTLATRARATTEFTVFDGLVPAAGFVLDPCAEGAVVSATQLEQVGTCAFRYFLQRGLGVRAIETGDRDQDLWLDPLTRGGLLHAVYATFMRRCRAEKRAVELEQDLAWIRAEGERILDELAADMPPPSADIDEIERAAFHDDLALFVREEARRTDQGMAIGFEVGFGRGGREVVEVLSSEDPVTLSIGGLTLRVAGRIDRIDQLADGTFEIVDYKTGKYRGAASGVFAGGRQLQHALYGLAVAELLRRARKDAHVSGARYYFTSRKGRAQSNRIMAQSPSAVAAVLADIREVITKGLFVHTPDEDSCRFCDYRPACGAEAFTAARAKEGDSRLEPWRRLLAHE